VSKLKAQPTQQDWQKWLAANPFASMRQPYEQPLLADPDVLETADLFCGAGGFSEGMRRRIKLAGKDLHLVCVNHWQTAIDTHKLMHPYADHILEDVGVVDPETAVPKRKLHLLLASPECRYFSTARGGKPVSEQGRMSCWSINRWLTAINVERGIFENVKEFLDFGPICGLLDDHKGKHIACAGPDPDPICGEEFGRESYFQIIDGVKDKKLQRKLMKQARKYGCPLPPDHEGEHDYTVDLPPQPCMRPIPERKGEFFQAWIASLWLMGYDVQWKVLLAADFGGATTRRRLFIQIRRDGKPIRWPEPTHAPAHIAAKPRLDGKRLLPWVAARKIIDWTDQGESIFERDRPLSENTRCRMARGLQRFGGPLAPLYIDLLDLPDEDAALYRDPQAWSSEQRPFVLANRANNVPRGVDVPIPAITTSPSGGGNYLVQPTAEAFMLPQHSTNEARSVDQPAPTLTTVARVQLFDPTAEPFIVNRHSNHSSHAMDEPLPTVTGNGAGYLTTPGTEPLLIPQHSGGIARTVEDPVPTITGDGHGVAQPMILPYHGESECYTPDEPLKTVSTKDDYALVQPDAMVVPYGPAAEARSVSEPTHTIPTRDRLALATPTVEPFLLNYHGDDRNGLSRAPQGTDAPLTTMHAGGKTHGLVQPTSEPFIVPHWNDGPTQAPRVHEIEQPLPTVTSRGAGNLVQPVLIQTDQTGSNGQCIRTPEQPIPTLHTKQNLGLVQPVLMQADNMSDAQGRRGPGVRSVDEPVFTVTTSARQGVVQPELVQPELVQVTADMLPNIDPRRLVMIDGVLHVLDIKYRMLKNPELARAMGFDDDEYHYEFTGTQTEITKQIGNAVEVHCASALVGAALYDLLPEPLEAVA
jgi:DNA (cytosine-5)-methyltransferase 1